MGYQKAHGYIFDSQPPRNRTGGRYRRRGRSPADSRQHGAPVRISNRGRSLPGRFYSYAFGQIETGEIEASIDAEGSVTFADDEPAAVSKAELDRALRVAQEQEQVLRKLEREIAKNKEYLQKVSICLFALLKVGGSVKRHGHLGSAKPGRRHELELVFELALYRRRIMGEFSREPVGRRGVLKKVKGRIKFLAFICVSGIALQSQVRRDYNETLVILFCLRVCVIYVGRDDQTWPWVVSIIV